MRRLLLYSLVAAGPIACAAAAQGNSPILTRRVDRVEWGVGPVADLRFGRVALVATPDGPRLEVRRLRPEIPTAPPARIEGVTPSFSGNSLIVADFSRSNRTVLGGYFSPFVRLPSTASATVRRTPDARRALALTCDKIESGFCGLWIQLYDFEAAPDARRYLDAQPFSTLSVWIRGHEGGEQLVLKVADAEWELKEDALPIGDVARFVPAGRIDTTWQQAVVPLDEFPSRIDRGTLALLVWEVTSPGTSGVDIGPVAFSLEPSPLPSLPESEASVAGPAPRHLATWIWNTRDLIANSAHRDSLLDDLEREGFDRVFLQLPDDPERRGMPGEVTIDAEVLGPLVAELNRRGMRVYALDGFARYALPEFHAGVLQTVDHVIRYNREVDAHERFFGIRYDIEPYILPAFHGPHREQLLRSLLQVTAQSADRARAAGLVYGADIPFWYDAPADVTSGRILVEWNGTTKPVSEHIIDLVDDVSIMDYRTTAFGADGTIRHATGELAYAAEQGKPVFIGLETSELPDEVLLEFRGEPRHGLPDTPPPGPFLVLVPAGDSVYVVHVPGANAEDDTVGMPIAQWFEDRGMDPHALWWWPITRRVEVPAGKITFARHTADRLREVIAETATEFERYPSFAGFALHFAESYLALLGGSTER
ncbi:MAG: hypothetical protein HKM89_11555 [Gemmatimonadales bacterium]|nr:hypothetical protein [Gemmatimonadales bacterium]